MTLPDPNTPDSSAAASSQQVTPGTVGSTAQPVAQANPLEGYVPEARLTGALQKINELTLTIKSLQDQLNAANTQNGELRAHSQSKETEWSAKVGEGSQALQTVTGERDTLKTEIAGLRAELEKAKLVGEMGHYSLLPILDQIPVDADPEKQKANIERMAQWANDLLAQREQALTAGLTGSTTQPKTTIVDPAKNATLPKTPEQWSKYLESIPYGTPEREQAWNDYWDAMQKPQS
jgi:hypothetical protein